MPVLSARRQAEPDASRWFQRSAVVRLVEAVHRQASPELTRVFGHQALFLRPSGAVPAALSGNLLANVLSLHREQGRWSGALHCRDHELPLLSATQSLVYASFVLETASDSAALLSEIARLLKPEGVLMLLTLNPWCPRRLQWGMHGVKARSLGAWSAQLHRAGLDIQRQRALGPIGFKAADSSLIPDEKVGTWGGLRLATLTLARRREGGLTPLRWATPVIGLRQGLGAS